LARNELEKVSRATWGEEFGGHFFELPFEVMDEFGSGADAVEERAVFGE
jgi:hypothetical protein